jgi:aspartyl-tRNA(Asn)/glutamyl-tRNA(Gln) amidotransferase subunit A
MQYADQLTVPANHAGIPAISIPGGISSEGLPIGIQFQAPDYREDTLFQVGSAYETATADDPWRALKPQVLR